MILKIHLKDLFLLKIKIMAAFHVQHSPESVQVTFDRKYFSEDELLKLLNFLRVEFLAKKINFGEDIETLGKKIKQDWWLKNKHRFIKD